MQPVSALRPAAVDPSTAAAPLPRELLVYRLPLLKGVCILGVVWTHVSSELEKMSHWSWLTGTLVMTHGLARFVVPAFIALSGFYLALNRRNERPVPFYRRTLKYLLVPYVAYTILYSLPELRGGGLGLLAWNLATALAWGHLWFMAVIIQLYLVHPFLARWYRASRRRGTLVLAALGLQTVWAAYLDVAFPPSDQLAGALRLAVRLGRISLITQIGYFMCGYYLLEHAEAVVRLLRRRGAALAGALLWLAAAAGEAGAWIAPLSRGVAFDAIPHPYLIHRLLTPFMTVGTLLTLGAWLALRRGPSARSLPLLSSLGLHAYGVYLLHPFVLFHVWGLARLVALGPDDWAGYLLVFPVTAAVTLAAVRLLARVPLGRYLI
jgi:surface polysaccharide O-acyltransferase-like enzyme